jgi:hypothetical protein
MNLKTVSGLVLYAFLVLGILECVTRLFFSEIPHRPILFGWAIASINYGAAITGSLIGLKKGFKKCMIIVLGGSGIRLLIMLIVIIVVMQFKNEWLMPFSISLLSCFVLYLVVEVGLIFKQGLITENR